MMFVRLAWFWILASGFGFPMGLPPGPEDPVVANVAPQECLFYVGWASMATPDPKSPNQLEQLFAEPEVQQLLSEVERLARYAFLSMNRRPEIDIEGPEKVPFDEFAPPPGVKRKAAPAKKPPSAAKEEAEVAAMMEDGIWLVKKAISSPGAVYLAKLEIRDPRQPPKIQAGAIVGLGDDAPKVRTLLDKYAKHLVRGPAETVKIGDATFYRIKPDPEAPTSTWGVYGKYFVIGLGDGEAEALVKRMEGKPPEWLTAVRNRLTVERPARVSYVNVRKIVQIIRAKAGPEAEPVIGALGLDNFISYASVSGLDKEGYASKSLLATEKQGGDLLAFLGSQPMEAKDLAPIPRDATLAAAARIDPDQIWQTVVSTMAKADPRGAERLGREIGQAEEHLGLKLREDLFQPLGGVWCIYNSPGEGGLVVTGLTAVGQLKDAKRAAATNQKLVSVLKAALEETGTRFGGRIKQFKCAGQDVFMLDLPGGVPVAPSWCVTDKELIVALFPQNVKAYLLRGPEYQSLAAEPEVAEMLKAEPGPAVVSYLNTPDLFRLVYPVVQIMARFATAEMQRQGVDVPLAVLPSAPSIGKHLRPGVTAVRRTKDGLETTARHSLPGQDIGASAPVMAALLLPAVSSAREAGRRSQCANNLKQIDLALLNYEQAHRSFPPAYTVDKNGKPLLSWRVLILPYLEQEPLYRQFHLDEPWDSEHNKKLIVDLPLYRCPSGRLLPGKTTYLTVRGKDTIFPGSEKDIDLAAIRDGTSNTIAVVDAGDQSAVDWTRPDDFTPDPKNPTKGLLGHHPNGFNVVFADCSVHFISAAVDPNVLRALFTRNGREQPVDMDQLYGPPRRRPPGPRSGMKETVKEAVGESVKEEFPPSKKVGGPEPRAVEPIRVKPIAEPVKEEPPKAEQAKTAPPKTEAPPVPQPDWPNWWGFAAAQRKAQTNLAKAQIGVFKNALTMFQLQNGGFPTTATGLKALQTASRTRNRTPYLAGPIPNDPWGRPYRYEYPGKHGPDKPDVWSLGPDGKSGTDDDIGNWSDR
jgi:type II secretion system protein G